MINIFFILDKLLFFQVSNLKLLIIGSYKLPIAMPLQTTKAIEMRLNGVGGLQPPTPNEFKSAA
jgi:hypothetical protein